MSEASWQDEVWTIQWLMRVPLQKGYQHSVKSPILLHLSSWSLLKAANWVKQVIPDKFLLMHGSKYNKYPRNIRLCTFVFAKFSGKQFKTFVISVAHLLPLVLQSCTAIIIFFSVISNGEDRHVWKPFRESSTLAVGEVADEVKVKPIRFMLLSKIL